MRISVIVEDKLVIIDGESFTDVDLSFLPPEFHAIQWFGNKGEIEIKDLQSTVTRIKENKVIDILEYESDILRAVEEIKNQQLLENSSKAEVTEDSITSKRNALLFESDWTQLPDSPLNTEQKELWKEYRQSLRDITLQSGFPVNITWPEKPE